jgi:signal transduction histidine kinase
MAARGVWPLRSAVGAPDSPRQPRVAWWEVVVGGAAVLASAAAVWLTVDADFLRYPGWLAAQKADLILGPVFVGLYWVRRRPRSRFGPMLIAFGFVGAVYVLQSSANPWLFGIGVLWENVIYLATLLLILAFPTGRLDGALPKIIVLAGFVFAAVPAALIVFLLPEVEAGASISGCRALCPENALAVTSDPGLALTLADVYRPGTVVVAFATAALLIWRFVRGTPPQRRALAIGTPIALVFLVLQVTYQLLTYWPTELTGLQEAVRWTFVGARALIWYGFLAALIGAQLFAARVMQRLIRRSLRRPSTSELEAMLREALGDPGLRLVFRDASTAAWIDPAGELPEGGRLRRGRALTLVERQGRADVAILHDAQLDDDPELLQAAGAVTLLAAENAELDAGWQDALLELRSSRARLVRVAEGERQRLERNLHDGVQQRLISIRIDLGLVADRTDDSPLRSRLEAIGASLETALDELREVSHGLYPPVLTDFGIVPALEDVRAGSTRPLTIDATGVGRHPPEVESAVYYCCMEAVQNAIKHGGRAVRISITLDEDIDELRFSVSDDGPGFQSSSAGRGMGLQNMRDRLSALDGRLAIATGAGRGTTVSGSIPLRADDNASGEVERT